MHYLVTPLLSAQYAVNEEQFDPLSLVLGYKTRGIA